MLQMVCIASGQFKHARLRNELVFVIPEPEHLLCHGKCQCFALICGKRHLLKIDQLLDRPGIGAHQILQIGTNIIIACFILHIGNTAVRICHTPNDSIEGLFQFQAAA